MNNYTYNTIFTIQGSRNTCLFCFQHIELGLATSIGPPLLALRRGMPNWKAHNDDGRRYGRAGCQLKIYL